MKLQRVRVQNYRSIRDTGEFEIERAKTIMVGPNEAGKSAILTALQQVNAPDGLKKFDPLRDYPRALYNDITTGRVDPAKIPVVTATFSLDSEELALIPADWRKPECQYVFTRKLDNSYTHSITGAPSQPYYKDIRTDLARLAAHMDREAVDTKPITEALSAITGNWSDLTAINGETSKALIKWIDAHIASVDEDNEKEVAREISLRQAIQLWPEYSSAAAALKERIPVFVLFSNYFRVRPIIHLEHLATRLKTGVLDDDQYDYGNSCLLKLLGFDAKTLSTLGNAVAPDQGDKAALQNYRDQLDKRTYQLNAASVRLTDEIRKVWNPIESKGEASRLRVIADGQYLKVVVEDEVGVEIELDQRSEGFQWLVSFFVVFFAEKEDEHENAILLLDEPGVSLHALKQGEFRQTVSRLAESNQTIFTTHSPFMVGADELDLVRVVELTDRREGTKVHTTVTSSDPGALLPLQEALGYDLAQSLFSSQKNLVLEGLTDYWYLEAMSSLLADSGHPAISEAVSLVPASSASKVVYFATILHASKLRVAALLDSDSAGESAATQDTLVHTLGQKRILRTKDYYVGPVSSPEIEDLLRETLVKVAKSELSWDIAAKAKQQASSDIVGVFEREVSDFSKYRLAKAFLKWSRSHSAADLQPDEVSSWVKLNEAINKALR